MRRTRRGRRGHEGPTSIMYSDRTRHGNAFVPAMDGVRAARRTRERFVEGLLGATAASESRCAERVSELPAPPVAGADVSGSRWRGYECGQDRALRALLRVLGDVLRRCSHEMAGCVREGRRISGASAPVSPPLACVGRRARECARTGCPRGSTAPSPRRLFPSPGARTLASRRRAPHGPLCQWIMAGAQATHACVLEPVTSD